MRNFLNIFFVIFALTGNLFAASLTSGTDNSIIFGVYGGKADVYGSYKDKLANGYTIGVSAGYFLLKNHFLSLESDFTYTDLSLKKSTSSKFNIYSLGLGPVIHISVNRYFNPYAGLMASVNYFEMTAINLGKNESTYKPGALLKTGFDIPVYDNISCNLGLKYSVNELSGMAFQNISYIAGVSYQYNFTPEAKVATIARKVEIDGYYESGVQYYKVGDGLKARNYFNRVIEFDRNYKEVENFLNTIKLNEEKYLEALDLLSKNQPYEALPLLIDTEKYLVEAFEKVYEIRSNLLIEEKDLEKNGIDAYNKEDYGRCIYYMKRLQLVNPDNENMKIYLPRAIKRFDAMQKTE